MPLSPRSFQCIGAIKPNGNFKAAMSSSSARDWNFWPRGFSVRAPVGGYQGFGEVNAFGSGESRARLWRGASYGYWLGNNGAFCQAIQTGGTQHRLWSSSPPGLPPKPADYRNWIRAAIQPPLELERFKILSYNILADYLARDHQTNLYFHIPNHILSWEWRKRRLLIEFGLWSADIMCFQEVDRFCDLEGELAIRGYAGIWKMRTGNAVDGCAIFWRTNRFQLHHEEHIEFSKLGLRDNVAQICVLESKKRCWAENVSAAALPTSYGPSTGGNYVIVCNIHVLYNPKRGEIKLGQVIALMHTNNVGTSEESKDVRILLDRAYAISKDWNNAPVIVCGDFNSIPSSPLYKFIAMQKLDFSGLGRDQISGQYYATIHRPIYGVNSYRLEPFHRGSEGTFHPQQGYPSCRPRDQYNMGNPSPIDQSNAINHTDVQLKACVQMSFGATAIKLGEVEVFGQQKIIHDNQETDKNRAEAQQNILDESCFQDRKFFPGSDDLAGGLKFSSTFGMDNLTTYSSTKNANFNDDNAPSFHGKIDVFSTMTPCDGLLLDAVTVDPIWHVDLAEDTLSNEKASNSSTGSANVELNSGKEDALYLYKYDGSHVNCKMDVASIEDEILIENMNSGGESKKVSSDNIFQKLSSPSGNLRGDAASAENSPSLELPLEENDDPNFFKELLGTVNEIGSLSDLNSLDMVLHEDSSFPISITASNRERSFYNPYCWSPAEIEIASGKEKCTVVEHQLKLRSVYTDVEDYTGTKGSSREPQVTSYNQQFMGTVDYIWCSEDLLTVTVLDTIPKHILQRTPGFPTQKWGSDHLALVCELAFSQGSGKK